MRVVAAAVLALLAVQEEKVENPQYKIWSASKTGSWVKHKMEMEGPNGQKVEMEITATLGEVTPEKLIIERKQTMNLGGRTMELPPQRSEVEAKVEKAKAGSVKITEKEEEITVAGKTLKCKVADMEMESAGKKLQGKAWFHADVPGGMAQGEFKSGDVPNPMKFTATAWEKK
jgi:hypothetical protein